MYRPRRVFEFLGKTHVGGYGNGNHKRGENMKFLEEEKEVDCTKAFVWGLLIGCSFWIGFSIVIIFFLQ